MRFNTAITGTFYLLVLFLMTACIDSEYVNTQSSRETTSSAIETDSQQVIESQPVSAEDSVSTPGEEPAPPEEEPAPPEEEPVLPFFITGAGLKGPMAFANVALYALDTNAPGYYNAQAPIAQGNTDAYGVIEGLAVPGNVTLPLVMIIDGQDIADPDTNTTAVFNKLVTLITTDILTSKRPVYATPLTTLAFYMAQLQVGVAAPASVVEDAVAIASRQVSSTVGFGMSSAVDILTTPPIINEYTVSVADQQRVAEHRAAIEALSAILHQMSFPVGDGLVGEYFDSMDLTQLALTRTDTHVDFDWRKGTPDPALPIDEFSTRWNGFVQQVGCVQTENTC